MTALPTRASAIFTASAGGCVNETKTGPGTQAAATAPSDCADSCGAQDLPAANAIASGFGLKEFACTLKTGHGSAAGGAASATVQTTYIITGPQGSGPVPGSLNFRLKAHAGGGIPGDGSGTRYARVDVLIGGVGWYFAEFTGDASSTGGCRYNFGSNIPNISGYLTGSCFCCAITTPEVLFPVNQQPLFCMCILASVAHGGPGYGSMNAFDTLYFPKFGPVFNLPEGYSAEIAGMKVFNNRVAGWMIPTRAQRFRSPGRLH